MLFRKREDVGDLAEIPGEEESALPDEQSTGQLTAAEQLRLYKRQKVKGPSPKRRDQNVSTRDTRLQRAEDQRNKMKVAKQISEKSIDELELIETHLGVDNKGFCLRHSGELICTGKIEKSNRFETIHVCKSCKAEQQKATPKGQQRQLIVDITGEVKQMHQNKRQWTGKTSQQGSYASSENDDDAKWKDEVALRVEQVIAWDNDAPVKSYPLYAKYFRMISEGILLDGIKQACEVDGCDSRILDFDPDRPLQEQLDESNNMTEAKKAEILWNASGQGHTEGVAESVQILHEAYREHLKELGQQTPQPQEKRKERAPPLRVPKRKQRSRGKKDKKEKRRVNRISMLILGSDVNRTNKLKNAREELEKVNDELLYTNQLINENNAKGGDMIFQIEALQKKLEERGRTITALTERVDDVKKKKKRLDREDSPDMASTGTGDASLDGSGDASLDGSLDDESETEHNGNDSRPMISIGDKIEIDQQTRVKKHRRRRKSTRSRKRGSAHSRMPNLDPVFLRKTFKERIRKLITINNFFQQASDAAMTKEMSADRKSSHTGRQSPLVDLVIPEDADIHYYNEEREFDENEEYVHPHSDLDTPDRPLTSPHLGRGRKLPKKSSIRHLNLTRPDSKVTWKSDDQLHTVRFIPGLPKEYFYTVEEIKMFRFEKFMDDNAEEFEIVEEGEWEEEEILEDDELSYESYEESYYEDEEEEVTIAEEIAEDNLQSIEQERLEEHERLTREEAERLAKEEQERQAHEEAERLANEEKERLAREDAERLAKEELERYASEEAARYAQAEEKRLAAEAVAEAKAKEEEQARVAAVHEATRKTKEEVETRARAKEESSRKTEEEAEARARAKEESRHKPEVEANAEKEPEQIERAAPFEIPLVPINEDHKEDHKVIVRERKAEPLQSAPPVNKNISTAERSVQPPGVIMDDLIDQIDAVIKRKSPEQDVHPEATKDEISFGASARPLPQPSQDRSPQTDDAKDPESNISEDKEAEGEFVQPALEDTGTAQHSLLLSLTDDQVSELRRTFHAFDTNGSGFVEHDELKANLKLLGHDISENDIEHLLTQVESKDSKLNFEEFTAWNRLLWKDDMKAKFEKIDSDNSGYIDKIQLKAYVVDMGYGFTEEDLDDMCYEMDTNSDDRIYLDDFINAMAASRAGNSYCIINGEVYIEKLNADFRRMDVDNSGFVTRSNLQEMANRSNYIFSQKELDGIMKEMDRDGDDQISIEDFIAATVSMKDASLKKDSTVKPEQPAVEEDVGERAPPAEAPSASDATVEDKETDEDVTSGSSKKQKNEEKTITEEKNQAEVLLSPGSPGKDEIPETTDENNGPKTASEPDPQESSNIDGDKKADEGKQYERRESEEHDSATDHSDHSGFNKSIASIDDWSSDDDPSRQNTSKSQLQESKSNLPVISITDKLEADKEAEVEGKKKKRRKRRKRKSHDKEPNLDPVFLRETFKQRIRKLITLNKFFQQAADMAMEKEFRAEKKSLHHTKRKSSLVGVIQKDELAELEALYHSDSEFDLEGDGSKSTTRSLASGIELAPISSSHTHTPPRPGLYKTTSVLLTKEMREARPKRSLRWKSDGEMFHVHFIPFFPEGLRTQFFYSSEEMKMFRFEKFMEDNADEYEVVEDEEEWETEEYEEVSWVSGDESLYDEETIEGSQRFDVASLRGGGIGGASL